MKIEIGSDIVITRQTAHARYCPRQPSPVTANSRLPDIVMYRPKCLYYHDIM